MLSFTYLIVSLPVLASALGFHDTRQLSSRHSRLSRTASHTYAKRATYELEDMYTGESFLDEWDFYSDADPTNGLVNYQTKEDAISKGLAFVQDDGTTVLQVDNTTYLSSGQSRDSVRISSKKQYNGGLFIASFWSMPHGCATWPAFWTVGPNWPNGGEIDILEGVNTQETNQYTLHTGANCVLEDAKVATSTILGTTCASGPGQNSGCAFKETDTRSYGHGFNKEAGGVYATLWDDSGISIYFFSRCEIPQDIEDETPDPSSWGAPSAFFPSSACSTSENFHDHSLVIDTTLCGDWSGSSFSADGCSSTCADTVADPTNFKTAKWDIDYIAVYQTN
ncbi:glycoside hydrolase family 16 protein [Mucidula mucida]|nr:glycoside hydrolase family 16 protein [Mucidula mucida]